MKKSESIAKLAQALNKAQEGMPVVKMNAQNPFLKNKYADLGAVIETSRPVLAACGLSLAQFPISDGERVGVTSILMHESGEWIEDTLTFSVTDSKGLSLAQSSGVVISYARRYSWASILGMYADEDVDGHTPPAQAKTEKKELTEAEKREYMLNTYSKLFKRAQAVKLTIPAITPDMTIDQMKIQYAEQKKFIEQAEDQAKAGA
jgi:hypothetical protein